jgi:Rrf2 family protein
MKISKKCEYALRALVAMARRRGSWTVAALAQQEQLPPKILEQVLLQLRRGGLLSSARGAHGGYQLVAEPSTLSVAAVIVCVDGPIAPVPCAASPPTGPCSCPDPSNCPIRRLMTDLRQSIHETLAAATIEDLVRQSNPGAGMAFEI